MFGYQAVDVVGQAGKPKTITGFQTHTTPVLLAYGERAELATEECILFTLYQYHNIVDDHVNYYIVYPIIESKSDLSSQL